MNAKPLLLCLLLLVAVSSPSQAQNYRTAQAYLADFEKNERFISESLVAHSASLINGEKASRSQATLATIHNKLERINAIIISNDKGFGGDTTLRDTFLKMTQNMLVLLDDQTLQLEDYQAQRGLDLDEMATLFDTKTRNVINYYASMVDYTNAKRWFSKRNRLEHDRYFADRIAFEYNAHQSLIFFKLNVLDVKLWDLLLTTDDATVNKCVAFINKVCNESLAQIETYKKTNVDQSLNVANADLIAFLTSRNQTLIPAYKDYIQALSNLNNTEKAELDKPEPTQKLHLLEQQLTVTKNKFNESLAAAKQQTKALTDRWIQTQRQFLKGKI